MAAPKATEAELLALLSQRYGRNGGNGPAYAFIPKVRSGAGHEAKRTVDAIAMGLWRSRGLYLEGFEIKSARSDWLRELEDPSKAEAVARYCDRFWLVVSDVAIVAEGELPPGWGLLALRGRNLAAKREAPLLDPEPIDRSFLAALLRAACRTGEQGSPDTALAVEQALITERAANERTLRQLLDRAERAEAVIASFETETGISIGGWNADAKLERVVRELRLILNGERDLEQLRRQLAQVARQAASLGERANGLLDELS